MTDREKEIEQLTLDIMHSPVSKLFLSKLKKIGQFIKLWHTQTIADNLYKLGYRKYPSHDSKEPLNEKEVSKIIGDVLYRNQKFDSRNRYDDYIASLICAKFSAPRISVEDRARICKCIYESDCYGIEMIKSPSGIEWAIGGTKTIDRFKFCPWCGGIIKLAGLDKKEG